MVDNTQQLALVTGANGMDGSLLSDLLLAKGWRVVGMVRRSSTDTTGRLTDAKTNPNFDLVENDVTDSTGIMRIVSSLQPRHIYNTAAMSHVGSSFMTPASTMDINAIGVVNLLEAVRQSSPASRVYQCSTSELFGDTTEVPQNETTRFWPSSPYGVAKLAAFHFIRLYREAYGLFACNGILFNHEGIRRGLNFVTRKITSYIGRLVVHGADVAGRLALGNLDVRRDWLDARDMVKGMYLILSYGVPMDFVLASGTTRTIRQFLEAAFGRVGLRYEDYVDANVMTCQRPEEVRVLCGDAGKARAVLGWQPEITFEQLVAEMVDHDVNLAMLGKGE